MVVKQLLSSGHVIFKSFWVSGKSEDPQDDGLSGTRVLFQLSVRRDIYLLAYPRNVFDWRILSAYLCAVYSTAQLDTLAHSLAPNLVARFFLSHHRTAYNDLF